MISTSTMFLPGRDRQGPDESQQYQILPGNQQWQSAVRGYEIILPGWHDMQSPACTPMASQLPEMPAINWS